MASEKLPTQTYYSSKMKQQPEDQAPTCPRGKELLEDRIYVGRIPDRLGEDELGHFFERFGRVSSVAIIPSHDYQVWIKFTMYLVCIRPGLVLSPSARVPRRWGGRWGPGRCS
jgi:hypothetical protein